MSIDSAQVTRLVLVGLPGAGKSTVGPLVAAALGWTFVDLDAEIEREAGKSVPEIFAAEGEAGFRRREREATARLANRRQVVVAPGGGWMLDPANRGALGSGAAGGDRPPAEAGNRGPLGAGDQGPAGASGRSLTVFLKVSPAIAATRIGESAASRPLLGAANPVEALTRLSAQRESTYLQANHTVSIDSLTPDAVASIIVALAAGGVAD
ncbi:MAG: hypothetical protein KF709_04065 [Gemmatimonadaceae bacterium]|nr:hypothetical protein [Gemmatimonadaceae bacterium]